jgi:NADPH2:quinone reductase
MKEAIVNTDIKVEIIDSPIPTPGPGDVLIKVEVSGSNPKDWKVPKWYLMLESRKCIYQLTI